MTEREMTSADMDEMCREYEDLEVMSILRLIMLSTTGMRLATMENAGQIATALRCKCCILDRLIGRCQRTDQL